MTNLTEEAPAGWDEPLRRIETTDPVLGGEAGPLNAAAKVLGWRTKDLRATLQAIGATATGVIFVLSAPILIEPLCDRWYSLAAPVEITVTWRGEVIRYRFLAGFEFDGRSGGHLADFVAPNLGTQELIACWLVHDANGYGGAMSFRETNALLRDMLAAAGVGLVRRWLIWAAVSVSRSWFGFPMPGDREFRNVHPEPLFWLEWSADGVRI